MNLSQYSFDVDCTNCSMSNVPLLQPTLYETWKYNYLDCL